MRYCIKCNKVHTHCNCTKVSINTNIYSESAGKDGMDAMEIDKYLGLIPQDYTYEQWRTWYQQNLIGELALDFQFQIDNLDTRLTQVELDLTTKADVSAIVDLSNRLTTTETQLTVQAGLIATKVNQTDFDDLGTRVSTAETSITQNSNDIALKASQSDFDALGNRVSSNEGTLTVHAGLIASKVSQTDFDNLEGTVTNHTTQINQNSSDILLRATKTSVDALGNRVTDAESTINVHTGQIALKVSQEDVESNFSMTPNKIKLFSTEIDMTSKVTFSSLDSTLQNDITVIDGSKITTGSITADKLNVNTLTAYEIRTASSGERFTVGFMPSDPSDPTSDPAKFSRHGSRQYHTSGKIAMYDGVVRNFEYQSGSETKIVNEYARIVFKDAPNSPVLYVLDSSSTSGIQYVSIVPDSFSPLNMRFVTAGALTDQAIKDAFVGVSAVSGRFNYNELQNSLSADLAVNRNQQYYTFTAGTNSPHASKLVMSSGDGSSSNAIPSGWYIHNSNIIATLSSSSNSVKQRIYITFVKYVGGLYSEEITREFVVEMFYDTWSMKTEPASVIDIYSPFSSIDQNNVLLYFMSFNDTLS